MFGRACGCIGTGTTIRWRSGTRARPSAPARRRNRSTSASLDRVRGLDSRSAPPEFPRASDPIGTGRARTAGLSDGVREVPRPRQRRASGRLSRSARSARTPSVWSPSRRSWPRSMNTIGTGYPWRFNHFRKTNGYANMPLDGVWLRAPYLHNGSVPTLRALLFPDERPARVLSRIRRLRLGTRRVRLDRAGGRAQRREVRHLACAATAMAATSTAQDVPAADREAIIEYLKTL